MSLKYEPASEPLHISQPCILKESPSPLLFRNLLDFRRIACNGDVEIDEIQAILQPLIEGSSNRVGRQLATDDKHHWSCNPTPETLLGP